MCADFSPIKIGVTSSNNETSPAVVTHNSSDKKFVRVRWLNSFSELLATKNRSFALTLSEKKLDLHSDFFSELLTTKNRSVCAGHYENKKSCDVHIFINPDYVLITLKLNFIEIKFLVIWILSKEDAQWVTLSGRLSTMFAIFDIDVKYELKASTLSISSIKMFYYTSPEVSLYKSNTFDWYVIPLDKM